MKILRWDEKEAKINMEERFLKLLAETFEMDEAEVKLEDAFRDYEAWDSLSILSLIAMLDQQYGITISAADLEKYQTVKNLFDYITQNKTKGD